ncbi:MAG: polysaccharide deacetylase family protein [Clostridia bacterium]|nr:polysaccharide deacetylase family protein [Clostridia bacterium]
MYKYSYKRILSGIVAILIILAASQNNFRAAAQSTEVGYSWFCVHAKDHKRPDLDGSLSWITDEKYGAYYIDPNCSDDENAPRRVLYLTFDVGYENGNVAKVLDTLKEKKVPGAFFVLSHVIEKETPLIQRMFDEGHLVCNHTAHHKDMSKITDQNAFAEELKALDVLCFEKTGRHLSSYYRPPEGRFSRSNLEWAKEMGYKTIFWSFGYADWDNNRQPSPETALEKIMSNVHNGAIILLHPTSATNAQILGDVIDRCQALGYRFETLDALTVADKDA